MIFFNFQSTVLRAAIGDFEDAQIYGSLQQSTDVNIRDKRHFFLPDIRSFALVALEVISRMCEKKLRYRHLEMEPENAPLMTYLSNMISDTYDGEFMDGCDGSFDLEEYTPVLQKKDYNKSNDFDPESICDELAKSMRSPGFATAQKVKKSESSRQKHKPNKLSQSLCVDDEDFVIQPDRTYSQASDLGKSHSKKCDRSESNISLSSKQAFEAFPVQSSSHKTKEVKKSESLRWLTKTGSILKSMTGADTTVSVFRAPSPDEHSHKHDITHESIAEEIETAASPMKRKGRKHKKREIDEFRSPHQHSEAVASFPVHSQQNPIECVGLENSDVESRSHTLEKKKSEDSKSAIWPAAPSPDVDIPVEPQDQLGEILDCLPGMAELEEVRKSTPSILELLSAKEAEKPLPRRSKFELVDYYAELKGRNQQNKNNHSIRGRPSSVISPADRKQRCRSADDSSTADDSHVVQTEPRKDVERRIIQTPSLVETKSKRAHPRHTRPRSHERISHENPDDEMGLRTSANGSPSKRLHSSIGSVSAVVRATDEQVQKRNRAQSALKRKLNQRGSNTVLKRPEQRGTGDLQSKYAALRRDRLQDKSDGHDMVSSGYSEQEVSTQNSDKTLPVNKNVTKFSKEFAPKVKQLDQLKHYSSFSSDESTTSTLSGFRQHDVSLSSSADPDTAEDYHMADVELPHNRTFSSGKNSFANQSRVTDSGFDSGSVSSEMSSDVTGHTNPAFISDLETSLDIAKGMRLKKKLQNAKLKRLEFQEDLPEEIILDDEFVLKTPQQMDLKSKQKPNDFQQISMKNLSLISGSPNVLLNHRPPSRSKVIEVCPVSPLSNDELYPDGATTKNLGNQVSGRYNQEDEKTTPKQGIYKKNEKLTYRVSNIASKRYRELTEKGVPLRVSVIDDADEQAIVQENPKIKEEKRETKKDKKRTQKRQNPIPDNHELFQDLDSKGFFLTSPRGNKPRQSPRKAFQPSAATRLELVQGTGKPAKMAETRMSLDDIIREIPEDNGSSVMEQTFDNEQIQHSREETLFNQPASESSESGSVPGGKCITPRSTFPQPAVMVDAELVIDRIFSQKQAQNHSTKLYTDFDNDTSRPLGLDKQALRSIADMSLHEIHIPPEEVNDDVELLSGMNILHVQCCKQLTTHVPLLMFNELLPADQGKFKVLTQRLQHVGQLGSIGTQVRLL